MKPKLILHQLDLNKQKALDKRLEINSLSTINTELKLNRRYKGLIFFVVDENKHYLFLSDLTNPLSLSSFISSGDIKGIISTDYSTLNEDLNNTNPTLGSIITVYPLFVSFIYDGSKWVYFSGTYLVTDEIQFLTIPILLRNTGNLVIFTNNTRKVILSDKTLSDELISITTIPLELERNRYYLLNGLLHYSINNELFRLGSKLKIFTNQLITNNNNSINHNLNSTYISCYIRININNALLAINKLVKIDFNIIDENTIEFISQYPDMNAELIITTI